MQAVMISGISAVTKSSAPSSRVQGRISSLRTRIYLSLPGFSRMVQVLTVSGCMGWE